MSKIVPVGKANQGVIVRVITIDEDGTINEFAFSSWALMLQMPWPYSWMGSVGYHVNEDLRRRWLPKLVGITAP
jgi:hypothetical protein